MADPAVPPRGLAAPVPRRVVPAETRAQATRRLVQAGADRNPALARMLRDVVDDAELEELVAVMYASITGVQATVSWTSALLVTMLANRVSAAFATVSFTPDQLMARHASLVDPVAQAMAAFCELPQPRAASAATGSDSDRSGHVDTDVQAVVRRSLEAIAASKPAVRAVEVLHEMAAPEGDDATLRLSAKQLELGEYGPQVAAILHQESLDRLPTGTASLTPEARALWHLFYAIRPRLMAARVRYFEVEAPLARGVPVASLVEAVQWGKLRCTEAAGIADTVPTRIYAPHPTSAETFAALQRNWAGVMAVVAECTPRDETVVPSLLRMARDTFYHGASPSGVAPLIGSVFAEMAKRAREHLTGRAQRPLEWQAAQSFVRAERMQEHLAAVATREEPVPEVDSPSKREAARVAKEKRLADAEAKRVAAAAGAPAGDAAAAAGDAEGGAAAGGAAAGRGRGKVKGAGAP